MIGAAAACALAIGLAIAALHRLFWGLSRITSSIESLLRSAHAVQSIARDPRVGPSDSDVLGAGNDSELLSNSALERKRRNERLMQIYADREQLYAAVVRSANDAIVTETLDGKITGWNLAAERLFGYLADEAIGQPIDIIVPGELRTDVHQTLRRVAQGEFVEPTDTVRMTKDGRLVDVSTSVSPVRSFTGEIIGAAKIVRDISEHKRLQEHLFQSQKMEAVGLMAGGIAHDFNNLMLVMMINAELLREELGEEHPHAASLAEVTHSIERAQNLTRQLLAFSRRQPSDPAVIKISDIVAGIHSMLRRILPANIEIATVIDSEIWPVLADKTQIEQVLINLAVNARDAMASGGRFGITMENRSLVTADQDISAGDYVAIEISDTGTGIAPENLGKIFDPFFTTKDRSRGTGLGLSICYGIVRQARGRMTVTSRLGFGTAFHILLPRTSQVVEDRQDHAIENAPLGDETILIVEDDNAVMRATATALERAGYKTLKAGNGEEARRIIDDRAVHLDLVLSDVVMPQSSGPELGRHVTKARPHVPVIFMTGYSEYAIATDRGDERIENRRVIQKPFHSHQLLTLVREVIDDRAELDGASLLRDSKVA